MMLQPLIRFLFGTLRGRLIVGVVAVNAVMMALLVGDLTLRQRGLLLDRQIEEANAMSLSLATSAAGWIAADDVSGLQELVEVQRRYPEVVFAILVDRDGRVLADTNASRLGQYMQDLPLQARQTQLSATPYLVDVATPAVIGGTHVGWARVGVGQRVAGAKLADITRDGVLYALSAIAIGTLVAWLMGRAMTRRLYAVQKTIDEVRSGNRLARSTLTGSDEAAVIAREFNTMLDAVAERDVELRLSEERYRSLIQRVQTAIVLHDSKGAILDSNPLARKLLGLSADQLLGKALVDPDWHFLREDGSVLPVQEYPASVVLASQKPLHNQILGIHRPGQKDVAWVLVSAEPEYDEAGGIAQVIVSFVDVTERKEAEEALHRSNRELKAISSCNQTLMRAEDEQSLLDAICRIVCDEAGYRFAWVGYTENDENKTIRTVARAGLDEGYIEQARLTWADTERGRGPAGTAVRTGKTACIQDFATEPQALPWREAAGQRGYRSVISLPLKDENTTFGILSIYSTEARAFTAKEVRLLEELAGDLAFGIVTLRSRDEHKRVQEALRDSEHRLKEAQRLAMIGNWELDLSTQTLIWSDEIYRIFEIDPARFGASYDAFLHAIHPRDRDAVNKAYTESISNRMPYEITHRLQMQDGRVKYVHERCETVYDPQGKPLRSVGTVQDITAAKLGELALERANRALRTLSACNMALVHSATETELLDSICRLIVETGGYRMAWVGAGLNDAQKTVRPVAQFGDSTGFLGDARFSWSDATELGRGPTGTAMRTGTVQINQNYPTNPAMLPWRDAAARRGYQSSIALPLNGASTTLGVLTIYAPEPNAFDEAEVPLLQELAADLAFGIETLRTRTERDSIAHAHLHHEEVLRRSLEQSIGAIADTVEARDPYTAGHQRRVADLAAAIAKEMGLSDERIQGIRLAASIHDLGKIQVPAEILSKPGRLSEIEFLLIKTHPESGYNILKGIQFPWPIADIVHQHHERLDGSGYPQGLRGDDILLESRILAVADVIEAMASHRPYRAAMGIDVALGEIERGRGSVYDAAVADTCLSLFREGRFAFQN